MLLTHALHTAGGSIVTAFFPRACLYDPVITVNHGSTGFTEKDPANAVKIGVSILA